VSMGKKPHFTQERLEECVDENDGFVKCPECGYNDAESSRGISMHYGYNHQGSIGYLFRCKTCSRLRFGNGQRNTYCSKYCEVYEKVGTLKHFSKGYLERKFVHENMSATEISNELGIKKQLVWKWLGKYNIGEEFDCPSCDRSFFSKQGVSKHHQDEHGDSIAGSTYKCENCGEKFWDMKGPDNHINPKFCSMSCRKTGRKTIENPLTGHILDSSWEEEVDKLLYKNDIDYSHEENIYHVEGTTNKPDFEGDGWIIEVKGYGGFRDQDRYEKIGRYFVENVDKTYILVAGPKVDMPCDVKIEWENFQKVTEIIS